QEIARHTAAHQAAVTTHAVATAAHVEAVRRAAPRAEAGPRSIEVQHVEKPAGPHVETALEREQRSARRFRELHGHDLGGAPRSGAGPGRKPTGPPPTYEQQRAADAQRQADLRRAREPDMARWRERWGPGGTEAARAPLPKAEVVQRPGLLARLLGKGRSDS